MYFRENVRFVAGASVNEHSHNEHRHNGSHGAEGDEAEAVVLGAFAAPDGGNSDAEGENERDGDGSRGDAAGVKGHREVLFLSKGGENKNYEIEKNKYPRKAPAEEHPDNGEHKEKPHAESHGIDEHLPDGKINSEKGEHGGFGHLVPKHL